jgi:hypothetical protein
MILSRDCQLDLLGSNMQLHTITAESLRTLPITNSSAENPLNSFVPFLLSWIYCTLQPSTTECLRTPSALTIHDRIYHENSAATVSTATALLASFAYTILVAAELQVPFLLPWPPTHSLTNPLSTV